nr:leukosialin [Anolis sagrei ordinatus]
MTTSRSLLFGFLILFTVGSLADTDVATEKSKVTELLVSTIATEKSNVTELLVSTTPTLATTEHKEKTSPGKHSDVSVAALQEPKLSTESPPSTSSSKNTTVVLKLPPKQTTVAPKLPPKQTDAVTTVALKLPPKQTTIAPKLPPKQTAASDSEESVTPIMRISDTSTSIIHTSSNTTAKAIVRQKYPVTTGKETSPEKTATLRPTLNEIEEETEMTMEPVKDVPDNITIGTTVHNPVVVAAEDPKPDSTGASSKDNRYLIIILAVAACILCLVAFLAFVYRRHRRRSGSTNFNQAGWAGQVALPDDSALDRDIEAEAVAAPGDRETRRSTLVTFFGKRQSRLPSVAMEDISGKKEKEECQQLLQSDPGPEGLGEANGKLSEPTKEVSENSSTLSKPEQGSS